MTKRVAVIGAGMGGLGAAWTLNQKGIPVTVFEPSHKAGGRMTTESYGNFHVDVGAAFVIRYFKTIAPLVNEIGLGDQMKTLARNGAALYRDGEFHTVNMGNLATLIPFKGLSTKAKLSALGALPDYVRHYHKVNTFLDASRGLVLDDAENAYDWMRRTTSEELADNLGDAVCRALCCYPLREMSKLSFMMYALLLKDLTLFTFDHGMGSVPAHLAKDLDIRYHTRAINIEQKGDLVEVTTQYANNPPLTQTFDSVVVAVPGDLVPTIVTGLTSLETAIFNDTQYSSTATVVLALNKPLDKPFYGVYLSPKESDIIASFGVEDAKGNLGVPAGKGCLLVLTREDFVRNFQGSKEELGVVVANEAKRFFPEVTDTIEAIFVHQWERAVEKMQPGRYSALNSLKAAWPADRRIFVAGAYLIAPCTDAAFHSGKLAAAQVIKKLNE